MSVGPLENIGHPILKKRPPHSPFESHFSIIFKKAVLQWYTFNQNPHITTIMGLLKIYQLKIDFRHSYTKSNYCQNRLNYADFD